MTSIVVVCGPESNGVKATLSDTLSRRISDGVDDKMEWKEHGGRGTKKKGQTEK